MVRQTRRGVLAGVGGAGAAALIGTGGTAFAGDEHKDDDYEDDDCEDDERPPREDAFAALKAVHASPDAPNVDVYVNGLPVLQDVPFGAVSGNFVLGVGAYRIQVTPTGEPPEAAVIDETLELDAAPYTVAAIGEVTEGAENPLQPLVLVDDVSPLEEGTVRVRFVHASPDAPAVDIVPTEVGDPVFTNVSFGEAQTVSIPEGEYTLEVRPAGTEDVVAEFPAAFEGGWVYSAWATGYLSPEQAPVDQPLDLLLAVDGGTPLAEH